MSPKPLIQHSNLQLNKNGVAVMADTKGNQPADSGMLPNVAQGLTPTGVLPAKQPSDNIRKLSYAAKSGQMQLQTDHTFDQNKLLAAEQPSSLPQVADATAFVLGSQLPPAAKPPKAFSNGMQIRVPSNLGGLKPDLIDQES